MDVTGLWPKIFNAALSFNIFKNTKILSGWT